MLSMPGGASHHYHLHGLHLRVRLPAPIEPLLESLLGHFRLDGAPIDWAGPQDAVFDVQLDYSSALPASFPPNIDLGSPLKPTVPGLTFPSGSLTCTWKGTLADGLYIEQFIGQSRILTIMPHQGCIDVDLHRRTCRIDFAGQEHLNVGNACIMLAMIDMLRAADQHVMHAACLASPGRPSGDASPARAVLISGQSGRGKTTTALALAHGGLTLLADDASFIKLGSFAAADSHYACVRQVAGCSFDTDTREPDAGITHGRDAHATHGQDARATRERDARVTRRRDACDTRGQDARDTCGDACGDASGDTCDASRDSALVWGLRLPCKVHLRTLAMMPWLGSLARRKAITEGEYIVDVREVLPPSPQAAAAAAIILLEERNDQRHRLRTIAPLEALTALARENVRATAPAVAQQAGAAFRAMAQLTGSIPCYGLSVGPRIETLIDTVAPLIEGGCNV